MCVWTVQDEARKLFEVCTGNSVQLCKGEEKHKICSDSDHKLEEDRIPLT